MCNHFHLQAKPHNRQHPSKRLFAFGQYQSRVRVPPRRPTAGRCGLICTARSTQRPTAEMYYSTAPRRRRTTGRSQQQYHDIFTFCLNNKLSGRNSLLRPCIMSVISVWLADGRTDPLFDAERGI